MPDYSKKRDNQMILKSITLFTIALLILIPIHFFFGDIFFNLLLNNDYSIKQIINYVYFLFPIVFFRGLTTMINVYFYYNNHILIQKKLSLITAVLSFVIFCSFGKYFGLIGFIFSSFLAEVLFLILSFKFIYNKKLFTFKR